MEEELYIIMVTRKNSSPLRDDRFFLNKYGWAVDSPEIIEGVYAKQLAAKKIEMDVAGRSYYLVKV